MYFIHICLSGGVIFAIVKFLQPNNEPPTHINPGTGQSGNDSPSEEAERVRSQLEEYDRMKQEGLITDEDYQAKKKQLLGLDQ